MTLSRRTLLTTVAGAAAAALVEGCDGPSYQGPDRSISIASGQTGGLYLEFATLLAEQINAREPDLHTVATQTVGSIANIYLVRAGRADLAMSQADAALAATAGQEPFTSAVALCSLGRVYEDYLQVVVRADGPLRQLGDLAGRTVSLGARGSGTSMISDRLMTAAGLRMERMYQSLLDAIAALQRREIDALCWSGGVPTPALAALHDRIGIRILPISDLRALRDRYRSPYQQVRLPTGGYGQPDVPTIGVANLLVCANTLPDDVAGAVARTLVERAGQLIPRQALGTQFLDPHTLIGTLDVPMHPGAANAYRQLHG